MGRLGRGRCNKGRFKSFPVQRDEHVAWVCPYVERNPLRAAMVKRVEDWRWSSLGARQGQTEVVKLLLPTSEWPGKVPADWSFYVNRPQTRAEEDAVRLAVRRSRLLGEARWVGQTAKRLGLESTLREPGRPRKGWGVGEGGREPIDERAIRKVGV